ncbi:MAG: LysR family transcriptional regulator [Pseudonocardiaceae bacterium]|nr:LysR family transcriptional regulator [Pseudonocardiaceae bacterium]
MLDLRRLRLLRELKFRGTIAAVAQATNYSAASVSQQLAQLEREAGVPLLERVGRGVRLTGAGAALVPHVDRLLAELERAEATLARSSAEVGGTVRVAAVQTTALWLVPSALSRLIDDYPALRVELSELGPEIALEELRIGAVDLVVGMDLADAPKFVGPSAERRPLLTDRVQAAIPAGHPVASAPGPVPLSDLRDATWVAGRPGTAWNDLLIAACRIHGGFEPDIRYRSNDYGVFLNLVAQNLAVALVPQLARPERNAGIAVRDVAGLRRDVFLAVRTGGFEHPAIDAVATALTQITQEFSATMGSGSVAG